MAENSHIEWTDHTFNSWIGCAKVSPGCAHCYAETLMDKRYGRVKWGKGQPRQRTSVANWKQPLRWNREADSFRQCPSCNLRAHMHEACMCGTGKDTVAARPRVFCASLADWLDDEVPIEWLADLLALIHSTPHLDWLLLTKRPENWRSRLEAAWVLLTPGFGPSIMCAQWLGSKALGFEPEAPANVWIGTTVEDQTRADERIPHLLKIPARVRFLSCEPLLEAVKIPLWLKARFGRADYDDSGRLVTVEEPEQKIHWLICGGESGGGARPMHPDWARSLRDQCASAGVPFLFKQWGEHDANGSRVGKRAAGRLLEGVEHNEFPSFNSGEALP